MLLLCLKKNQKIPEWLIRPPGAPVNIHWLFAQLLRWNSVRTSTSVWSIFRPVRCTGRQSATICPKTAHWGRWERGGCINSSQKEVIISINNEKERSDLRGWGEMVASFHFLQQWHAVSLNWCQNRAEIWSQTGWEVSSEVELVVREISKISKI